MEIPFEDDMEFAFELNESYEYSIKSKTLID